MYNVENLLLLNQKNIQFNTAKNLMEDSTFLNGELNIPVGYDKNGKPIFFSMDKFSHMLIGGTTGSGKTTYVRTLLTIISTLSSCNSIKYLISDSKGIDYNFLSNSNKLLVPVINDERKTAGALGWLCSEAYIRQEKIKEFNVHSVKEYNSQLSEDYIAIPTIICVIDDAYIISNFEESIDSIKRILRIGSVVDIHLILVTSTPTNKIIPSEIKMNIPVRLSFYVPTKTDSRMILGTDGAENITMAGDFILKTPSRCVKGTAIFEEYEQLNIVLENINYYGEQDYSHYFEKSNTKTDELDPLFEKAVEIVIENKIASTSLLQRKLSIGYFRGAKLMDQLEEQGIISPLHGAKPREIYMNMQKWLEFKKREEHTVNEKIGNEVLAVDEKVIQVPKEIKIKEKQSFFKRISNLLK